MVSVDHVGVALIVLGALSYLVVRFRTKKEGGDCCCGGKAKRR